MTALAAWLAVKNVRTYSWLLKSAASNIAGSAGKNAGWQIVFQNSRSRSTRRSGGLPAISAVFSAPIEMPAIQFSGMPASCNPSNTPA
ncbi:Uncharacterised protein [Burkholderia pseudomallei]|nr:Uncharacterised protein [Burkholderia pseudomallei]